MFSLAIRRTKEEIKSRVRDAYVWRVKFIR